MKMGLPAVSHPHLRITTRKPDNRTWLELARINLQPGVTEISDPADPDNPGGNQINQNHVLSAGAVGVVEATDDGGDAAPHHPGHGTNPARLCGP